MRVSFDGFRLSLLANEWTIDAFAVRQTKNKPGIFDDEPNSDLGLWGVYAVRTLNILPGGHIEVYFLGNENKQATYDAEGTGYELRHTGQAGIFQAQPACKSNLRPNPRRAA